ncbi:MAG: CDP-alcohol phosphatidyltransferase family protein [Deltaproteobacteria bacterium]|nr:CDP-alcohol phosphatidyltransferase family protein [Deltaproteobacteria bacterium]MBW2126118.1 CDP-alcohol phosphatidyltransferase family protein [Deltaproteobacteria bacterium]
MLDEQAIVTLDDAEEALTIPKGWWAYLTCLFLTKRISVFLVNKTKVTANQVTIFSTFLSALSAVAFFRGPKWYYWAAILYWMSYLFDCVDGTVARLRKQSTLYGGYLDAISEYFMQLIMAIAFAYGYFKSTGNITIFYYSTVYCFFFMFFYWDGKYIKATLNPARIIDNSVQHGFLSFFDKRNIVPYPRRVESSALIFVLGPITGYIIPFYLLGLSIIVGGCCLKVGINLRRLFWPKKYDNFSRKIETLKSDSVKAIYIYNTGEELSFAAIYSILKRVGLISKVKGIISHSKLPIWFFSESLAIEDIPGPLEGIQIVVPYLEGYSMPDFRKTQEELVRKGFIIGKHFIGIGFDPYCKILF